MKLTLKPNLLTGGGEGGAGPSPPVVSFILTAEGDFILQADNVSKIVKEE